MLRFAARRRPELFLAALARFELPVEELLLPERAAELFFAAALRPPVSLPDVPLEDPVALRPPPPLDPADLPARACFQALDFFALPPRRELVVVEPRDARFDRLRPPPPRDSLSAAVSALTSLLKLLLWPSAVSS